jgi:hypothetical protein
MNPHDWCAQVRQQLTSKSPNSTKRWAAIAIISFCLLSAFVARSAWDVFNTQADPGSFAHAMDLANHATQEEVKHRHARRGQAVVYAHVRPGLSMLIEHAARDDWRRAEANNMLRHLLRLILRSPEGRAQLLATIQLLAESQDPIDVAIAKLLTELDPAIRDGK